jgi:hypothetical protein
MRTAVLLFTLIVLTLVAATAGAAESTPSWLPAQKPPRSVVRAVDSELDRKLGRRSDVARAQDMLLQSVAGLAAQAVNEGRSDELVWIDVPAKPDYARWYTATVKRLGLREQGPMPVLDLVRRYAERGIIKGYVLYKANAVAPGLDKAERRKADADADESINVATTLAGLLGGVIVSEELEPAVRDLGVKQLFDARGKTSAWCFQTYAAQLNRSYVMSQRPRVPYARDVAIAHRMLVMWDAGDGSVATPVYRWLNPLSTVLGWVADEGEDVAEASRFGHVVVPSDICLNLPLLSAAATSSDIRAAKTPRLRPSFDPRSIDRADKRTAVAFMMSDGDNLQWAMGGFFGNPDYWASADHGKFPIGFGVPVGCLREACPVALDHLAATQPATTTVVEASGYIFPDVFGEALDPTTRRERLAMHARRLGQSVAASGATSLIFICRDVDSPAAIEAYGIFAREIPELAGMFVIQYAPYHGGDGRVFWVKNAAGVDIPVVSSKFSLWANNDGRGFGNPMRIAELVNGVAKKAATSGESQHLWVMTHAWSPFQRDADGAIRDLPFGDHAGDRGVSPTRWCVERLDQSNVRVVSPAELLWRIRMRHDPKATAREIDRQFKAR